MASDSVEILFVAGSSRDSKGRRVLVREGTTENTLWPDDDLGDPVIDLLGISNGDREHIAAFFRGA